MLYLFAHQLRSCNAPCIHASSSPHTCAPPRFGFARGEKHAGPTVTTACPESSAVAASGKERACFSASEDLDDSEGADEADEPHEGTTNRGGRLPTEELADEEEDGWRPNS